MKVFFIRHGESENNKNGLWTGWLDTSLTQKGRAQAEQVGELLSKISFDKIYVSDLSRAKTTAEIVLPAREYEVKVDLREINVGSIAGTPLSSISGSDRDMLRKEGYGRFGGESQADFCNRIREFFKLLEEQGCENIAVFSHAGVLRNALDIVLGIEVPRKNTLCKNCAVAVFEYNHSHWSLHSWINLF